MTASVNERALALPITSLHTTKPPTSQPTPCDACHVCERHQQPTVTPSDTGKAKPEQHTKTPSTNPTTKHTDQHSRYRPKLQTRKTSLEKSLELSQNGKRYLWYRKSLYEWLHREKCLRHTSHHSLKPWKADRGSLR